MNRNQQKQAPISKGRAAKRKPGVPYTAQQTIPYQQMYRDGICRVDDLNELLEALHTIKKP